MGSNVWEEIARTRARAKPTQMIQEPMANGRECPAYFSNLLIEAVVAAGHNMGNLRCRP